MTTVVAALVAAAVAVTVSVGDDGAGAATATTTFTSVADGTADAATPSAVYGDVKELGADSSPAKQAYVRFSPTGLAAKVDRAVLRVHIRNKSWATSPSRGRVQAVASTTWTEAGLTYAARPALGAIVATGSGAAVPDTWVEFDVTSQVKGNGPISLAITSTHDDGVYYDAREAGASVAPQLVVTHSTTAPVTTTTAAPTTTTTAPPTGSATTTLRPSADATVDSSTPAANQGTSTSLLAGATPARASHLRFDLSGLTGPITKAELRLHVANTDDAASTGGGTVLAVADTSWGESAITWANRPATSYELWRLGAVARNQWVTMDLTWAAKQGPRLALAVTSAAADLVRYDAKEAGAAVAPQLVVTHAAAPPAGTQTLLAAGDIAGCQWPTDESTAKLLDAHPGATIATLGDNVQVGGTTAEYNDCFAPTWGRHKARIKPSVGNHEYKTDRANPYWDYFGAAAGTRGQGWYSYDLGPSWHVVVLNGNCWEAAGSAQCGPNSAQYRWLQADLAASDRPCTLAYWHQPFFSSVARSLEVGPLWDLLYAEGTELVMNGHTHNYERFAPQRPDGTRDDARGIRQFEVGTGGTPYFYDYTTVLPNSEVRNNTTHGVLKLDLKASSYSWNFLPVAGQTFTDSGTTACH